MIIPNFIPICFWLIETKNNIISSGKLHVFINISESNKLKTLYNIRNTIHSVRNDTIHPVLYSCKEGYHRWDRKLCTTVPVRVVYIGWIDAPRATPLARIVFRPPPPAPPGLLTLRTATTLPILLYAYSSCRWNIPTDYMSRNIVIFVYIRIDTAFTCAPRLLLRVSEIFFNDTSVFIWSDVSTGIS